MSTTLAPPRRRLPVVIPAAVAAAWVAAIAAELTGRSTQLHHGALIGGSLIVAWVLFLLAWQVMFVAMMLPTAIPMIRVFNVAAARQPNPRKVQIAFLAGYAAVWTEFGALAFAGDLGVHQVVGAWPWLQTHGHLIAAATLAVAGAFQFSSLKDRCLTECRHPGAFLLRYYRRQGARAAFFLGARHGLSCAGCCWALMLVMFGAGVANLWWMAVLTAVMVFEKTARGGDRLVPVAGVVLLASAVLVLLDPAWLPPLFGGSL